VTGIRKTSLIIQCLTLCSLLISVPAWSWCVLTPPQNAPYFRIISDILDGFKEVTPDFTTVTTTESLPESCNSGEGYVILGPDPYQHFGKALKPEQVNIAVAVEVEDNPLIDHWFKYILSPNSLAKQLSALEPNLKTVHIVTNPQADQNLLDTAFAAFEKAGIQLENHQIREPKYASRMIEGIIKKMKPDSEALWISPHHGQYGLPALLPTIIKQSLYGQKMSIGNNLQWIDKGIYLGLFPDNIGFGREIGEIAKAHETPEERAKEHETEFHYIESASFAANRKTLRFLNKKHTDEQLEMIKLWLPKN